MASQNIVMKKDKYINRQEVSGYLESRYFS